MNFPRATQKKIFDAAEAIDITFHQFIRPTLYHYFYIQKFYLHYEEEIFF